jgi:hypothetical protein
MFDRGVFHVVFAILSAIAILFLTEVVHVVVMLSTITVLGLTEE